MMENDSKDFHEMKAHAEDLKAMYGQRDRDFTRYEEMYLLDWQDENPKDKAENVKITTSPDARNAVLGAARLMYATDPIWHVSEELGNKPEASNKIEKACGRMWNQAGRLANIPIHYDAVLSALLYGEIHMPITRTEDLVAYAKSSNKGSKRAERIARLTPFLFECWNPKQGYPEFDSLGLSAYYRENDITVTELVRRWGEDAAAKFDGYSYYDKVTQGIFYDLDTITVWADDKFILQEPHGLEYIPVSCTITEGSRLFTKYEHQRQPLLYALLKSGLWNRQNLLMTVLFTNIYHLGLTPTFTYTAGQPSEDPAEFSIDFDRTLIAPIPYGGRLEPINSKGLIDPAYHAAMEMIESKTTEATLYKQALGQPMGGSAAFSTVSLMSQQGRLPLISTQRRGGWGLANTMEIALQWGRTDGFGIYTQTDSLLPSDIPEDLQLEAKLDIRLPQDKLQQANIADMLVKGRHTSKRWTRENILNIEQSDEMDEEIQTELATQQMMDMFAAMMVTLEQQKISKEMFGPPPGQEGPPPGQEGPPQGPPMEGPPGPGALEGPQMAPGPEGQGFNPAAGGLPPQQAGMLPGQGPGGMPPEEEGMM